MSEVVVMQYDLEDRLVEFAVLVCRIAEGMPSSRLGRHVSGQLVRCGTSPAPNYGEAHNAESRRDFIHKMSICLKELRETFVWLKFAKKSGIAAGAELDQGIRESDRLVRIFAASIRTAQRNQQP
jgi:four helix bundle protein